MPPFSESSRRDLNEGAEEFGEEEGVKVKEAERMSNHDVKAMEYVLKERFKDQPEVSKVRNSVTLYVGMIIFRNIIYSRWDVWGQVLEFIHFACTSEDINNLAHAMMLRDAVTIHLLPSMDSLISALRSMAHTHGAQPMLSRKHGQVGAGEWWGRQ